MQGSINLIQLQLAALNALPIGLLLVADDGVIVLQNERAGEVFGYLENELVGKSMVELIPHRLRETHEQLRQQYQQAPVAKAMGDGRFLPSLKKDGSEIQVELGLTPVTVAGQKFTLISVLDLSNKVLKVSSYNDPLTGLVNRKLFHALAENLRNLAIRNSVRFTLMSIDLDGFKTVNDQHGHYLGDMALCRVAEILSKSVRQNDITSRVGGDEFLVCMYGVKQLKDLKRIACNLIQKITAIKNIDDKDVSLGASIGVVSTLNPESMSLEVFENKADELMYQAKRTGKGRAVIMEC